MDYLSWYVAGPLIGIFVPLLLLVGNKQFGVSSSFDYICAILIPGSKNIFKQFNYKMNSWKVYFIIGIAIGALITNKFLFSEHKIFLPEEYYSLKGLLILFVGGLFVGFGTRYANGCTSGHAITGLSLLKKSSLIATVTFFATGSLFTFLLVNIF